MALTPLDIHNKKFGKKLRGYDTDEVNAFLDQVISDYQDVLKRNADLEKELQDANEKVQYFTDLKDALNQSIIVAQDAADRVKSNAQREANIIQSEAEKQARNMVDDSTDKANHILQEASEKARQITQETGELKKQTRIFRQRLQVMLESQLEIVKSPEWHDLLADDNGAPAPQALPGNAPHTVDNPQLSSLNFDESQSGAPDYGTPSDGDNQYGAGPIPATPQPMPAPTADASAAPDSAAPAASSGDPDQSEPAANAAPKGSADPQAAQPDADNQAMDPDYFTADGTYNGPVIEFPDGGEITHRRPK